MPGRKINKEVEEGVTGGQRSLRWEGDTFPKTQ